MDGNKSRDSYSNHNMWSRRSYLVAATGIAALSGCAATPENGGEEAEETETETEAEGGEHEEELPEGVSEDEFENGPVPDMYVSVASLGNEERNPDELKAKSDVGFVEYKEAQEIEAHEAGTCCGNCGDFIPDKNGDAFGACAEVSGYIGNEDWCTIWDELPEPSVPEGMSEDELATAEVPEEYRTADSQGGEARTPDDLLSHEDVGLTESVEAIAEQSSLAGQSCGNCAEFIPDKNGDGWGACAKVEGYIAVEDWCGVWEHITEVL